MLSVDSLDDAVRELEGDETEYAGVVIHSVTHDSDSMEVVEFFTRAEGLRTIILPEPDGELCERRSEVGDAALGPRTPDLEPRRASADDKQLERLRPAVRHDLDRLDAGESFELSGYRVGGRHDDDQ